MFEVALFSVGFALIATGAVSLLYPLRWLGIGTRTIAFIVIATGFLVVAIVAQLGDSYFVYLGLVLALLGLISLICPLRFLSIRTRVIGAFVLAFGTLLSMVSLMFPYSEKQIAPSTTKLRSEEHTSELQSPCNLVCRLLLEKKKK